MKQQLKISPSLLSADFGNLAEAAVLAEKGGGGDLHIEVESCVNPVTAFIQLHPVPVVELAPNPLYEIWCNVRKILPRANLQGVRLPLLSLERSQVPLVAHDVDDGVPAAS